MIFFLLSCSLFSSYLGALLYTSSTIFDIDYITSRFLISNQFSLKAKRGATQVHKKNTSDTLHKKKKKIKKFQKTINMKTIIGSYPGVKVFEEKDLLCHRLPLPVFKPMIIFFSPNRILWRERNDRIFEYRERTLEEIKALFFYTLYLWTTAFVFFLW